MELSKYEEDEFKAAFDILDVEGDGSITVKEIGVVMRALGKSPTDAELQAIINEVDLDGNGSIEFGEFLQVMILRMCQEPDDDELREAFRVYDKENTGYIGIDQLRFVLMALGQKLTEDELEDIIRDGDEDRDGRLSYEEYCNVMSSK
ncbi:CG11165 [Drosophila busckii]|uniref:CG11165 n=1 Tax=Drosophila busckii TaxID=30019 RepID=A0A0M4EHZ5_DROBS|nr:neo-calmodulin-like [Drosophila busckii]ALC42285.1 CG11165 [Drosophila busckii]